jgi:hypothetical protein
VLFGQSCMGRLVSCVRVYVTLSYNHGQYVCTSAEKGDEWTSGQIVSQAFEHVMVPWLSYLHVSREKLEQNYGAGCSCRSEDSGICNADWTSIPFYHGTRESAHSFLWLQLRIGDLGREMEYRAQKYDDVENVPDYCHLLTGIVQLRVHKHNHDL